MKSQFMRSVRPICWYLAGQLGNLSDFMSLCEGIVFQNNVAFPETCIGKSQQSEKSMRPGLNNFMIWRHEAVVSRYAFVWRTTFSNQGNVVMQRIGGSIVLQSCLDDQPICCDNAQGPEISRTGCGISAQAGSNLWRGLWGSWVAKGIKARSS